MQGGSRRNQSGGLANIGKKVGRVTQSSRNILFSSATGIIICQKPIFNEDPSVNSRNWRVIWIVLPRRETPSAKLAAASDFPALPKIALTSQSSMPSRTTKLSRSYASGSQRRRNFRQKEEVTCLPMENAAKLRQARERGPHLRNPTSDLKVAESFSLESWAPLEVPWLWGG